MHAVDAIVSLSGSLPKKGDFTEQGDGTKGEKESENEVCAATETHMSPPTGIDEKAGGV